MFKLGRVCAWSVRQWAVLLHDAVCDKAVHLYRVSVGAPRTEGQHLRQEITYRSEISFHTKAFEISTAKHQGTEIVSDGLVEAPGGGERQRDGQRRVVFEAVAVDANLVRGSAQSF